MAKKCQDDWDKNTPKKGDAGADGKAVDPKAGAAPKDEGPRPAAGGLGPIPPTDATRFHSADQLSPLPKVSHLREVALDWRERKSFS